MLFLVDHRPHHILLAGLALQHSNEYVLGRALCSGLPIHTQILEVHLLEQLLVAVDLSRTVDEGRRPFFVGSIEAYFFEGNAPPIFILL